MYSFRLIRSFAVILLLLQACGGGSSEEPSKPPVSANKPPQITGVPSAATENQNFVFVPQISDPDNDTLSLTITNKPDWLSFSTSTGELSGIPLEQHIGDWKDIKISVSDGQLSDDLIIDIKVNFSPLEEAIRTGKASIVEQESPFLQGIAETIEANKFKYNQALIEIFKLSATGQVQSNSLNNIHWDPTHDASLLEPTFGFNTSILYTNAVTDSHYTVKKRAVGILGEKASVPYIIMGGHPFRNWHRNHQSVNGEMHQLMKNAFEWLTKRSDLEQEPFKIVISQMDQSFYFPDQVATRSWLQQYYPSSVEYNKAGDCDSTLLLGCLTHDTDLLIISQKINSSSNLDAIMSALQSAEEKNIPVLYLHHDGYYGDLAEKIFTRFNVKYQQDNYWHKLMLSGFSIEQDFAQLPREVSLVSDMIERFANSSFSVNLSLCDDKSCPTESGYQAQFKEAADYIRDIYHDLDQKKINIFNQQDYRLEKLLILLADHYRQSVSFPMDKSRTGVTDFLQSMYADHAVYNYRTINPVQNDMGNFSRSDFSQVSPVSQNVKLQSKPNFRAAGVYALPGVTFTVTRKDNESVNTKIFINTLRNGATHEFSEDGYNRPKFLQSQSISIASGETLRITSSYGGPIQISFDQKDIEVEFDFNSVGLHPFWQGEQTTSAFEQALSANLFDWAEVVAPSFEVHSKRDKMLESINDSKWGSVLEMANATMRYTHNFALSLAGFSGPSIDIHNEVTSFVNQHQLTIQSIDQVKHMNADQATCGYGCSGNPYDAYWSFDPVGHGDLHEVGHGLERGKFRFSGWEVHTTTNLYSYYAKHQYYLDTGSAPNCQSLPFKELYEVLQESLNQADPFGYMQNANLNTWNRGVSFYLQLMMSAQGNDALVDGWQLWPRLHILEREFAQGVKNEQNWLLIRDRIGFSGWTLEQAKNVSSNDWMLIANAFALKRDVRNYFTLWGLNFSATAASQVAGFNFASLPLEYYAANGNDFCLGLDKDKLPIDGNTAWPF